MCAQDLVGRAPAQLWVSLVVFQMPDLTFPQSAPLCSYPLGGPGFPTPPKPRSFHSPGCLLLQKKLCPSENSVTCPGPFHPIKGENLPGLCSPGVWLLGPALSPPPPWVWHFPPPSFSRSFTLPVTPLWVSVSPSPPFLSLLLSQLVTWAPLTQSSCPSCLHLSSLPAAVPHFVSSPYISGLVPN